MEHLLQKLRTNLCYIEVVQLVSFGQGLHIQFDFILQETFEM